jgi:hypothetical protein
MIAIIDYLQISMKINKLYKIARNAFGKYVYANGVQLSNLVIGQFVRNGSS